MEITSLCFNAEDFTNFISFVKSMNSKDKSKYSKLVLLHAEKDKLVCKAVDGSAKFIEYCVDLYDSDNPITESFAVSINDLAVLVKCSSEEKFTIRKCFNQYEFSIVGSGWHPFKTIEVEDSKFKVKVGSETFLGKINSCKLRNSIASVLGYTQEYTYARDKYIQFNKDKMVVTSRQSSVITKDEFPEMTIHRDEAALLKSLLKDNFDLTVNRINNGNELLSFIGPRFKFTVTASGIDSVDVKYIDGITDYITINGDELYKLVTLAEEYSASKKIIGMLIKDGCLKVSVKNTLAARNSSIVNSIKVGDVKDTKVEAEVPSHSLLKSLKLFQDKHSREINIYITDEMLSEQNCIMMFDNNTQAKINIYNR